MVARHPTSEEAAMTYQNILVSTEEGVAIVTLNRPDVLNALNQATMNELVDALEAFDRDDAVRCIVLAGSGGAFAAGAGIKEKAGATAGAKLGENRVPQAAGTRHGTQPVVSA